MGGSSHQLNTHQEDLMHNKLRSTGIDGNPRHDTSSGIPAFTQATACRRFFGRMSNFEIGHQKQETYACLKPQIQHKNHPEGK
ncbi:hypothetical protein A6X21_22560 [Planctopirus hydrillae]|uniref:Uncharacterized protein n=1 Tax=Planctopirus hydrillae TaxID=1841610 RepID=A0A1C3EDE3_9PLAN|nr:hypothetical protein A6X21_22560 [Planctopirus hydrillae]